MRDLSDESVETEVLNCSRERDPPPSRSRPASFRMAETAGLDTGARFCVSKYSIISARSLVAKDCEPGPPGYASKQEILDEGLLSPMLAPSLAVRLADLDHA